MKTVLYDIKWIFNYIASIIMYAIIVILIGIGVLVVAYFIDFKLKDANRTSPLYGAYVIVSGSMEPVIKIRDAIIIRRADASDVKIGDVVTYRSMDPSYYGILVTHRVVDIKTENGKVLYITKGDNNATVDHSPVDGTQILGKVIMRVPKIGYLKYFLISSYGWIIAIVIPSVAIIGYDIFKLVRNISNSKRKNGGDIYEN